MAVAAATGSINRKKAKAVRSAGSRVSTAIGVVICYVPVVFLVLVEFSVVALSVASLDSSVAGWMGLSVASDFGSAFSCTGSSETTSLFPVADKGLINVTVSSLPYCANFCSRFSLIWAISRRSFYIANIFRRSKTRTL